MIEAHHLLGPPLTAEYEPPFQSFVNFLYDPNRPIFTPLAVDAMLADPRVRLGMALIRGPILSNSRFFVHCDESPEAKADIANQINRFWRNGAPIGLRSMQYGYQPAEVIYRSVKGQLNFDRLRYIHPRDAKVRTLRGMMVGMDVGNISNEQKSLYVGCPKAFWTVHDRESHRWYGLSRLYGAFPPWYEKWARRGQRDQRQLFFFKYSFRGPVIEYPPGASPPPVGSPEGTPPTDNRHIAQKMGDKYASGATATLPAADPTKPSWKFHDPLALAVPDGLMEYGYSLDDEIWEGMEIPPEVARSARQGGDGGITIGGGAGRSIPQQAFYSILSENAFALMTDFDEQIIAPLVRMKWGPDLDYDIECFGLLRGQDQDTEPGSFEQSQGQETVNLDDGNPKDSVKMSDHVREPIVTGLTTNEEKQLARHYRRISDYQFRLRSA